tara:strand:+ start:312 stop:512 length:201 start_codon:yes stop_codon:yes gene_type:complete
MDCVEEVSLWKREIVPQLGSDERLSVDLLNGKLSVDLSQTTVSIIADCTSTQYNSRLLWLIAANPT